MPPSVPAAVAGSCHPRFAPLREAFAGNFTDRGERGAALCVTLGGRTVADLWGGWADAAGTRPWGPDTLVNVFSIGKGLAGVCAARLAGQARLDVDAPVTRYWPEFATAGKEAITVRQILSHQAGLPAIRRRMPPGSMLDWDVMTTALAAQEPWWQPGTGHGYHVNTFGFLLGEIVRRLFAARRADIECFARDLEARGRAWATITRRLCTVAGFYRYAVEEELLDHSPAAHVRRPRLDYESHATGLDRNELGALLVAAGLGPPGEHALISLLALNGLRVLEATGADIEALGIERGHWTLVVTRKGGKIVTIPLAPRTARAIDLATGERSEGPIFLSAGGAAGPAWRGPDRPPHRPPGRDRQENRAAHAAFITAALDARVPLRDVQEAASHADPRTTMRYDRARTSLDRHATYIVAAYVAGAAR